MMMRMMMLVMVRMMMMNGKMRGGNDGPMSWMLVEMDGVGGSNWLRCLSE
jgi:hypothetical protein